MQTDLGNLEWKISGREPLKQHSTAYAQRAGWATSYEYDPNRPASGGWSGCLPIEKKIPITVTGRRIAVIDAKSGTIDALVVGRYVINGDTEVAVASPNSYAVRWDTASGQIVVNQVNGMYAVNLDGKKVVGVTKREMTELRRISATGY